MGNWIAYMILTRIVQLVFKFLEKKRGGNKEKKKRERDRERVGFVSGGWWLDSDQVGILKKYLGWSLSPKLWVPSTFKFYSLKLILRTFTPQLCPKENPTLPWKIAVNHKNKSKK